MGRRAILVRENNGQYEIAPNARLESYKAVVAAADSVRVVEALTGPDYDWLIETDLGWFFVTGWKKPREKETAPPVEICVPSDGAIIRYAKQRDARLVAKEWGGHVHREPTADCRSYTWCVCGNPACTD